MPIPIPIWMDLQVPEAAIFNVTGANKGVILEIRRERTIELVQEGRRLNDLFRWKCGKMIDQPMYGQYFPIPVLMT